MTPAWIGLLISIIGFTISLTAWRRSLKARNVAIGMREISEQNAELWSAIASMMERRAIGQDPEENLEEFWSEISHFAHAKIIAPETESQLELFPTTR